MRPGLVCQGQGESGTVQQVSSARFRLRPLPAAARPDVRLLPISVKLQRAVLCWICAITARADTLQPSQLEAQAEGDDTVFSFCSR
jgi:hypothetical protein